MSPLPSLPWPGKKKAGPSGITYVVTQGPPFGSTSYQLVRQLCKVAICHESSFSCSPQNCEFLEAFTVYKTFWDTNLSKFLWIFFQPTQEQSNHPLFSYRMASLDERLWIESVGPYMYLPILCLVGHLRMSCPVNMLWSCAVSLHTPNMPPRP